MRDKFYSLRELASLYDISYSTIKQRIEPIINQLKVIGFDEDGEAVVQSRQIRLYSPKQVELIFKLLGKPKNNE